MLERDLKRRDLPSTEPGPTLSQPAWAHEKAVAGRPRWSYPRATEETRRLRKFLRAFGNRRLVLKAGPLSARLIDNSSPPAYIAVRVT